MCDTSNLYDSLEKDCIEALRRRGSTITKLHSRQLTAVRKLLDDKTVIQRVRTGGGKTLVAILMILLPIVFPDKYSAPQSTLVFSPTVALLLDTKRRFENYGILCWGSSSREMANPHCGGASSSNSAFVLNAPDETTSTEITAAVAILVTIEFWDGELVQLNLHEKKSLTQKVYSFGSMKRSRQSVQKTPIGLPKRA